MSTILIRGTRFLRPHRALLGLLAFAAALRLVLILSGGQLYWPDERRYMRSASLLASIVEDGPVEAVATAVKTSKHLGYTFLGTVPAVVHQAFLGTGLVGGKFSETLWISASVLSLASLACVALVYMIALRANGSRQHAWWAALLMASSSSMLIYTRHLLPYDCALALMLLALWLGLDPRLTPRQAVLCGTVAGLAFLTYYGYWHGVALALTVCTLAGTKTLQDVAWRGLGLGIGLVSLPLMLQAWTVLFCEETFFSELRDFSAGITQGDTAEGWSLPWAYLWHAEHGLLVLWVLCAISLGARWLRAPRRARHGMLFLACAAAVYGLLVWLSTILGSNVVYGRTARQMVPFLCLAAAAEIATWRQEHKAMSWAGPVLASVVVLQAAFNFAVPLRQQFPSEVMSRVEREYGSKYGRVGRTLSVEVAADQREGTSHGPQDARLVLVNAQYLYPILAIGEPPPGRVVFSTPHPVMYRPFQYEGEKADTRAMIRDATIEISLIDTADK